MDARAANQSYAVRVLLCADCGAPYEALPTAGDARCEHCGVTHRLTDRDETLAHVGADLDEQARIAALRAMPSGRTIIPKRFERLLSIKEWGEQERKFVNDTWKEAYDAIANGKRSEGWELSLFTATWYQFTTEMDASPTERRARTESALEVLTDPRYRTILHCKLAGAAARVGDVDSAERWLAPCDGRATDLRVHSEYCSARAIIALRRGDHDGVHRAIGAVPGEVPLHDSYVSYLGVLRAHAHQELGHIDRATEQLAFLLGRDRRTVEKILTRDELLVICEKVLPAARERLAAIDKICFDVSFPRVMCEHCGAEIEIEVADSEAHCAYCNAASSVALKPIVANIEPYVGTIPGAADIAPARREKLAAQAETWVIPEDLAPLFSFGLIRADKRQEAEALWREEIRLAAAGEDRGLRLLFLTLELMPAGRHAAIEERRRGRALLESTLRVISNPLHTQRLHCAIALSAARNGDHEAAATWLSRCDAITADLGVHSSYVHARARISNLRGDFAETVRILGPRDGDTPVTLQSRVGVALARAAALEQLGRADEAVASLAPVAAWADDARVAMVKFAREREADGEPSPVRSVERAITSFERGRMIKVAVALAAVALLLVLVLRR